MEGTPLAPSEGVRPPCGRGDDHSSEEEMHVDDRPEERSPESGGAGEGEESRAEARSPGAEDGGSEAGEREAPRAGEGEARSGEGSGTERGRRSPWSSLTDLQETVGEIVDSAIRNVAPATARTPRYDLVELPDGYWLLMDLPGVPRSEFEVTTSGEELTVSGRRPRPDLPEGARIRSGERAFGRFRRVIRIPPDVDAGGIAAKLEEGVLRVTLPRRAGVETQRVEVQ